jgi:hypothetical protein
MLSLKFWLAILAASLMLLSTTKSKTTTPTTTATTTSSQVYVGTVNPNNNLRETEYHRSEFYSYIRLPGFMSKINDVNLTTTAEKQCEVFAKKYGFTRNYVEVEEGDSDYFIAWCLLKKKYEYVRRQFTDANGKQSTTQEYFDLYNGGKAVPASTIGALAQKVDAKHKQLSQSDQDQFLAQEYSKGTYSKME